MRWDNNKIKSRYDLDNDSIAPFAFLNKHGWDLATIAVLYLELTHTQIPSHDGSISRSIFEWAIEINSKLEAEEAAKETK